MDGIKPQPGRIQPRQHPSQIDESWVLSVNIQRPPNSLLAKKFQRQGKHKYNPNT